MAGLCEERSPEREMMFDVYKDVYHYDEHGNAKEREEYDRSEKLTGKTVFNIDENGNLVETHYYVARDGQLILGSETAIGPKGKVHRSFDVNGNVINRPASRENPEESSVTQTDKGKQVEILRYDVNKKLMFRTVTNYDQHENETRFSCYEADGEMYIDQENRFEFDIVGNWVKQITLRWVTGWGEYRLHPYTSTRRIIQYFEPQQMSGQ